MLVINGGSKPCDGALTRSVRFVLSVARELKTFEVWLWPRSILLRASGHRSNKDPNLTGRRGSFTRSSLLCFKPDSSRDRNWNLRATTPARATRHRLMDTGP